MHNQYITLMTHKYTQLSIIPYTARSNGHKQHSNLR